MSDTDDHKDDTDHSENLQPEPDAMKLENLLKRRKVYGDITQNASETELLRLLVSKINNGITSVKYYYILGNLWIFIINNYSSLF